MKHLIIDARNILYRAIFGARANNIRTQAGFAKYHYFIPFIKLIVEYISEHSPDSVHVCWDAPKKDLWRRKILPEYKTRAKSDDDKFDITEELAITTSVALEFFKYLNIRQYSKSSMEADDLIYALVTVLHPEESVIVSTDSDMIQIPFNFSSCKVYDPRKKVNVPIPACNPVMQKAIVGDTSDTIPGYYGIGPKKSEAMLKSKGKLADFFRQFGYGTYLRNMLLIDLSLNPKLLNNKIYAFKQLENDTTYSESEISKLISKYKVNGFMQESSNIYPVFKKLV